MSRAAGRTRQAASLVRPCTLLMPCPQAAVLITPLLGKGLVVTSGQALLLQVLDIPYYRSSFGERRGCDRHLRLLLLVSDICLQRDKRYAYALLQMAAAYLQAWSWKMSCQRMTTRRYSGRVPSCICPCQTMWKTSTRSSTWRVCCAKCMTTSTGACSRAFCAFSGPLTYKPARTPIRPLWGSKALVC